MSPHTSYRIRVLPQPHLLEISLSLRDLPPGPVRLELPTWVPGAYGFMKYARDLFDVEARCGGQRLEVVREGWSAFRVERQAGDLEVSYRAHGYAPEWGELAGVVDHEYAVLLGTRCLFTRSSMGPCTVRYELPSGWNLHHPAGARELDPRTFEYPSYAALLDTPVIAGEFTTLSRQCRGVPFHHVFVDRAVGFEAEAEGFVDSVMKVAEQCAAVFGGFPFESYSFIYSFDPNAKWGLEHANATMIGLSEEALIDPQERAEAVRVCAHELFHAWNVCRLKPEALARPDFAQGSFTDALWVSEGFTRYYEFLLCARAGELSPEAFWSNVVNYYRHLEAMPAYARVSPQDSSRATFLNHGKFPGSINGAIDYYDAGMLVAFDLDAHLRLAERPTTLDAEFCAFYRAFAEDPGGFTGEDLLGFFARRVPGSEELLRREAERPGCLGVPQALERLGFEVSRSKVRRAGLVLKKGAGPEIENVLEGSPAGRSGLAPGDVIASAGGYPFGLKALRWLAARAEPFSVEVRRGHRSFCFRLAPEERMRISHLTWRGTEAQAARIREWLGAPALELSPGRELPLDSFENFHGVQEVL